MQADGALTVELAQGLRLACGWLQTAAENVALAPGDHVLVMLSDVCPVVIGRIGGYRASTPRSHMKLETTESLTLQCGEARIDLRSDGKVMVCGEDVLLRSKGTQRIRAGHVAIN